MKKYEKRGVSATKSEVHQAIKGLDKGIFPNAFCKVLPDYLSGDPEQCIVMHADTAGTKTSLAYLYWRETGDLGVWKNIIQDAIVMNLDDLACIGVTDNIILSNTIGRNKKLIPGEVIRELISGTTAFVEKLRPYGVNIHLAGGETADVGDIVRTADVGFTAFARLPRKKVVVNNIQKGDVIVSFASFGQATYEEKYNSGIGSNGLTFARHETLSKKYAEKYPESFDPSLDDDVVYSGKMDLIQKNTETGLSVGELLLSPTRTYLPVIRKILGQLEGKINGIIHCTGGGQTKVLHFIDNLRIIKDSIIPPPPVFRMIREQTGTPWEEMYQVFNMGMRLEFYLPEEYAGELLEIAQEFNIEAKITGYVTEGNKAVEIHGPEGILKYD